MASTFSPNLSIELIGTGDQAGTWGTTTNSNLGTLIEQAISGYVTQAVATGTDTTITIPNGSTGVARNMYIELTGTGGASTNLIVPSNKKLYFIFNNSTGAVTVKVSGQTGVSVPTGKKMVLVSNGTDIVNGLNYIADFGTNSFTVTNLTATSATITNLIATSASITTLTNNPTFSAGTANGVLFLNGSKVATSGSALTFDGTQTFSLFATGNAVTNLEGSTTNNAILRFRNGTTGALAGFYGNNSKELIFEANGTTEQMRLTSTGLGIGTASPTAKLDIGSGNLAFSSTAQRITADMSNGTVSNRFAFQTSTTNGNTQVNAIPNGTSTGAQFIAYNNSDPNNASSIQLTALSTTTRLLAGQTGTGTYLPITFFTNGSEQARIDTSGNLGIGTASPVGKLQVTGSLASFILNTSGTEFYNNYAGQVKIYTSNAAGFLSFGSGGRDNDVVLSTTGNLGIGTASPAVKLQVKSSAEALRIEGTTARGSGNIFASFHDPSGRKGYWGYGASDDNLYIANEMNAAMLFLTNAVERARITSAGRLGIATTIPEVDLQVGADTSTTRALSVRYSSVPLYLSGGFDGTNALSTFSTNAYANATGSGQSWTSFSNVSYGASAIQLASSLSGADIRFLTAAAVNTNPTERARITSGGNLLVGTTSAGAGVGYDVRLAVDGGAAEAGIFKTSGGSSAYSSVFWNTATTGNNLFALFGTEASITTRGSISYNRAGGLVAYNTTSDYRAKDILGPVQNSGATIDALKVYEGQMKGATQSRPMLVAHEAQEHAPYTVTGEKDAVNEDGTPNYQQMDVSALVPLLLAEVQSLRKRVAELESK